MRWWSGTGSSASPAADPATLLRRVTLDLTGLPPTPAEADAFLADPSDEQYAQVVERLLASPRFGERWAAMWLDLARFADTQGYEKDNLRTIWAYRDWVIKAFNDDLPYDRFTIEQLAGDLLPEPDAGSTDRDRVSPQYAHEYGRRRGCGGVSGEGGARPREYHLDGLDGHDSRLRAVPRSPVGADHPARVLPVPRFLQ